MLKAGDRVRIKNDAYYYQGGTGTVKHIGKFRNGIDCLMVVIDGENQHHKSFEPKELEKI
jgi:hypothetical protein